MTSSNADSDTATVENLSNLSTNRKTKRHLPYELLVRVFSNLQLPGAAAIGRARDESLNVPKSPSVVSGPAYVDNNLDTGGCTNRHAEWTDTLRALSAIAKSSRRFRDVVTPILYSVYPGQTLVSPQRLLAALEYIPHLARHVKELVIDPWDPTTGEDQLVWGLRPGPRMVAQLERSASGSFDEACAVMLLSVCTAVETLDITTPIPSGRGEEIFGLLQGLRALYDIVDSPEGIHKSIKALARHGSSTSSHRGFAGSAFCAATTAGTPSIGQEPR